MWVGVVRGTSLHKGANNFCPEWCYSGYFGEKVTDMINKEDINRKKWLNCCGNDVCVPLFCYCFFCLFQACMRYD